MKGFEKYVLVAIVAFLLGVGVTTFVADVALKSLAKSEKDLDAKAALTIQQLGAMRHTAVEKYTACAERWNSARAVNTYLLESTSGGAFSYLVPESPLLKALTANSGDNFRVRWVIPFDVDPMVNGDTRGARYVHFQPNGQRSDFIVPQTVQSYVRETGR